MRKGSVSLDCCVGNWKADDAAVQKVWDSERYHVHTVLLYAILSGTQQAEVRKPSEIFLVGVVTKILFGVIEAHESGCPGASPTVFCSP